MLEEATIPAGALRTPGEIDAHLMLAALDAVPVVLCAGQQRLSGRFDLADGFGEISFIDQRPAPRATAVAHKDITVEYYLDGSCRHAFSTRVIGRSGRDRLRLARPRRIERSERRIVPRFRIAEDSGCCFTFTEPAGARPAEVADLSNAGALLRVPRSVGLTTGGQTASGWMRLGHDSEPMPVTVEVRHVSPFDAGRVSVGVRFVGIRFADQVRITKHIVALPGGHVA